MRDVRLGNRTSVGSLLEERPCADPRVSAAGSVSCWRDRNIVSVTDQCDAGDRSLHRERPRSFRNGFGRMSAALLKRGRTRRPRSRHFNCHAQAQRSIRAFPSPRRGPHRRPGSKAWHSTTCCLILRSKTVTRLRYRSPRRTRELPRGAATYKRPGVTWGSEELRCVQDLWTQAALLANEQWNESFRRIGSSRGKSCISYNVPVRFLH